MAFSCQSPKSPPRVSFGWTGPASIRGLYLALLLSLLWQDCCLPANWCYLLQPQYFYDATDPSSGELICDWSKLECCRIGCHVLSLSAGDGFWWPFKLIFNNLGQSQKHTQIPMCGVLLKEHRNRNTAHDNWQHLTLLVPVSAVLTWNTSNVNCDWKPGKPDQKHKHKLWLETLWARPETPQDLSHASRLCGDSLAEDASNDMYRHQHPIQNEEENMEQDILQLHSNSN